MSALQEREFFFSDWPETTFSRLDGKKLHGIARQTSSKLSRVWKLGGLLQNKLKCVPEITVSIRITRKFNLINPVYLDFKLLMLLLEVFFLNLAAKFEP